MGCSESKVGGDPIAAYDNGKKVTMGSKYKTAYNGNPGPGEYDVVSPTRLTKERKYEAMIFKYDDKERKKPGE